MPLFITEIFYSIQGESLCNGRPCVFVRLSGCNLRCSYCDTQYAYESGDRMTVSEILNVIRSYKCQLVEITGGEPMIQTDTPKLIHSLVKSGFEVLLETNGSIDTGVIDDQCMKIIDIKCPSSNETDKNNFINLNRLTQKDQIKFVIGTREDFKYAINILKQHRPDLPDGHILFSPVFDQLSAAKLTKWILNDHLNVRLHLQLHKFIWPDKNRGV